MKYFLPILLFFITAASPAQTTTNSWYSEEYMPVLRGSYLLESGSFIYAENRNFLSNFPSVFGEKFLLNRLNKIHNLVGYEHRINAHWYPGLNLELRHFPQDFNSILRGYMFHAGKIGKIQFNKRIGLNWLKEREDGNAHTIENNQLQLNFIMQLASQFKVGKRRMEIRAEEEALWFHSLEGQNSFENRWVDQSIHRLEAGYNILNNLWVYLGGRISSRYFFREFQAPEGEKLNFHTGGLSFKVHYILRSPGSDKDFKPDTKISMPWHKINKPDKD